MLRSSNFNPLYLRSGAGKAIRILVILLIPAVTTFGQELGSTSEMISYEQSSVCQFTVAGQDSAANPLGLGYVSTLRFQFQMAELNHDPLNVTAFSAKSLPDKQNDLPRYDELQLLYKKLDGDRGAHKQVHFEAGYGQFYQEESTFGEAVMEREQPSCAYLKARFSF